MLNRVLVWVGGWRKESLRRRAAVKVAVKRFQATKALTARSNISKVIAHDSDGYVVRVCYGDDKLLRRAWYMVGPGESSVIELVYTQVKQYGERPQR